MMRLFRLLLAIAIRFPQDGTSFSPRSMFQQSPSQVISHTDVQQVKHLQHLARQITTYISMSSSNMDGNHNQLSDRKCPLSSFSMKYPRFRVPVSSRKDYSNYSAKEGLFSGFKRGIEKAGIEKKYSTDVKNDAFFWIEPEVDVSEDTERMAKGKIGIFASAAVWRKVAETIDSYISGGSGRTVISIPRASIAGLSQLVDIINWYNEKHGEDPVQVGNVKIVANLDDDAPIPTVVLTAMKGDGELRESSDISSSHVINGTKSWVKRVLVKLGICPFTKSITRSGQGLGDYGVPVGNIAYHHSRACSNEIPHLMADTWDAILGMILAGDSGKKGISSILLSAPEFDHEFSLWAGPVFAMLEANVGAASAEPLIGVVCFHPLYRSPDGKSFPGFGHMHSVPRLKKWLNEQNSDLSDELNDEDIAAGGAYQRRTPYATINVLRAEQLEAAEGRRSTAELYATNIKVLHEFGFKRLEEAIANDKRTGSI